MENSFKEQVKESFIKCKKDIDLIKNSQLKFKGEFNEKLIRLKEENLVLKDEILTLKNELSQMKKLLYSLPSKVVQTEERSLNEQTKEKIKKNDNFKDPYEALMSYKKKKNKKRIIQQKIIQLLNENEVIDSSELKYLLVDHYQLCSKATFYNYLKEIELKKIVEVKRIDGKNIIELVNRKITNIKEI